MCNEKSHILAKIKLYLSVSDVGLFCKGMK